MKRFLLSTFYFLLSTSPAWGACVVNAVGAKAEVASGNLTLNAPASPANNDIWIAVVSGDEGVAGTHAFTNWTEIRNQQTFQGNKLSTWYFRYAGSTPNLIVTRSGGAEGVGGIAQLRGCDTVGSPIDTLGASTDTSNSDTADFATITPLTSDTLLLAVWSYSDDLVVSTPPSGFTLGFAYMTALAAAHGIYLYHKAHTSGATGAFTATMTSQGANDEVAAYLIAITQEAVAAVAGGLLGLMGVGK